MMDMRKNSTMQQKNDMHIELPVPQEGEKLMELCELVEMVKCEKISTSRNDKQYPKVGIGDLSSDYLKSEIKYEDIKECCEGIIDIMCGDALLYRYNNGLDNKGYGRVARLSGNRRVIGLEKGIIPIRIIDKDIITEDFLLRALTLEETLQQVRYYVKKTISHKLSKLDFLRLKVIVPSLESQNEICRKDYRSRLSEMDKKSLDENETFRRDTHMQKHAIGQTIFALENWWSLLQKVREDGHGIIDDKAMYGRINPIPVVEIFNNLQIAMEKLKKQIHHMDRAGNGMVAEMIALTEFIEDYIRQNQNPLFSYEYDSSKHHSDISIPSITESYDENGNLVFIQDDEYAIKKGDPIEYVKFPVDALTIIFDNIISNACAHGFAGKETGNKVKIDIIWCKDDEYAITIANNGTPINPELTGKDIFTYGKTSQGGNKHFGIGGYEVYRLMKEFNGEAELILSPDDEYPVTYKLTFKETNIIGLLKL